MGALFVRSLEGRGGTRKQLGNHSKEFNEQCTGWGEAGRGPAGRSRAAGASAGRSDTQGGGAELAALGTRSEYTPAAAGSWGSSRVGRLQRKRRQAGALAGQGLRLPREAVPE